MQSVKRTSEFVSSAEEATAGKTVVFIFDYVMHYHAPILKRIENHVKGHGGRFVLLTAAPNANATGRVPAAAPVVGEQVRYRLFERTIGGFTIRHQRGVVSHLLSIRPDVVITMCHSGTISEWLVICLKLLMRFKLVAWQCGYEYNPGLFKRVVLSRFIPRFDHHLAYHTNAKSYALSHGAKPHQITVMHNTVDEGAIECIDKEEARRQVSALWPQVRGKHVILYVGAILAEKKLEVILEALNRLERDDILFMVVGDGPHLDQLRRSCNGREDVCFVGRVVDGVGKYFDAADLFVLPGTGGLAINEAMAHGLPVIAGYADGSADDLVVDGVNGFRLREGSSSELAKYVAATLDDPARRAAMGAASTEMIRGRFSFSKFVDRVVGVIDGV